MGLSAFLTRVVEGLTAERIPAMLTGSLAAAVHGATRATMDLDVVIDPSPAALPRFVARMRAAGYYVSDEAAREALAARSMFNVIDPTSGWKADLIVRKHRAFSEVEFARREPSQLLGVACDVATVEDLVLAKLEWATLGGSARQLEDVATLLRLAGPELDEAYLRRWIPVLGVQATWQRVPQPDTERPSPPEHQR